MDLGARSRVGTAFLGLRALTLALASTLAFTARAEEPKGRIAVVVQSEAPCPDAATFLGALEQRLPSDVVLDPLPGARQVAVHLHEIAAGRFRAELTWQGQASRAFEGDTCDTVARAALLSISLSAADTEAPSPEGAPATTPPTPSQGETEARTVRSPPSPAADGAGPPRATPPTSATRAEGVRVTYGALVHFFGAAGPSNVAVGGAAEIGLLRNGPLQPAVRLSLTRGFAGAPTRDAAASAQEPRIRATLLRTELCPIRVELDRFYVVPSLGFDIGVLALEEPQAPDTEVTWAAPIVLARGGFFVAPPLAVELAAGIELPLTPVRFVRFVADQPEEIYASPPAGLFVEAALTLSFP